METDADLSLSPRKKKTRIRSSPGTFGKIRVDKGGRWRRSREIARASKVRRLNRKF